MARYSTVLTHQTLILLEIISIGLACKYKYASDNLLNVSNLKVLPILIRENLSLFVQCFQQQKSVYFYESSIHLYFVRFYLLYKSKFSMKRVLFCFIELLCEIVFFIYYHTTV